MSFDLGDRIEDTLRRAGLAQVPRPIVGAAALVTACAVAFALWRFWPASGDGALDGAEAVGSLQASEAPPPVAAPSSEVTATAVVHVVGAVRSPGVYELAEGSRVADAIDRAGGMLPDAVAAAINLARPVTDGEQVLVPDEDSIAESAKPAAPAAAGAGAGTSPGTVSQKVDVNTADATALDALPGVGPSTATKIIAEREANGPFATVDDLSRVSGIGPKRLDQLRDLVSVGH